MYLLRLTRARTFPLTSTASTRPGTFEAALYAALLGVYPEAHIIGQPRATDLSYDLMDGWLFDGSDDDLEPLEYPYEGDYTEEGGDVDPANMVLLGVYREIPEDEVTDEDDPLMAQLIAEGEALQAAHANGSASLAELASWLERTRSYVAKVLDGTGIDVDEYLDDEDGREIILPDDMPVVNWGWVPFEDITLTCELAAYDSLYYPVAWYEHRGYCLSDNGFAHAEPVESLLNIYRRNPQLVYDKLNAIFPGGKASKMYACKSLTPPQPIYVPPPAPRKWFLDHEDVTWEEYALYCHRQGIDPLTVFPSKRIHRVNTVRFFFNDKLPRWMRKHHMKRLGNWLAFHAPSERCLVCGKPLYTGREDDRCSVMTCAGGGLPC
jgi:hypothetical protein